MENYVRRYLLRDYSRPVFNQPSESGDSTYSKDGFCAEFVLSKTMFMFTNIFIYNYGRNTRQLELQYINNIFECSIKRNKVDGRLNSIYVLPAGSTDNLTKSNLDNSTSDSLDRLKSSLNFNK